MPSEQQLMILQNIPAVFLVHCCKRLIMLTRRMKIILTHLEMSGVGRGIHVEKGGRAQLCVVIHLVPFVNTA